MIEENNLVTYNVVGGIAWLTLNRPEKHNALNAEVRGGLWSAFRRFAADDARVLVLTGAGTSFCAGGDLEEMANKSLKVPESDYLPLVGRNIEIDKPTIAAVNGIAFGGGFLLAQNCDLCVASESAAFGITEARWGRGAPWAALLPRLIPPRVAMEILLTGEPISARRAFEIGLVNQVVKDGDLRQSAQGLAERIAANAPLTVKASKSMVRAAVEASALDLFEQADQTFIPVYTSADAQEGPRAHRERRAPRWQGQ